MKPAKNIFWCLLNGVLAITIVLGIYAMTALSAYKSSLSVGRTVSVEGSAKASMTPDMAQVSFGIVAEGRDPQKLQNDASKKMSAAIAWLEDQGIDEADIKTENYSLAPKYVFNEKKKETVMDGYALNQNASVKIRDLDLVGAALSQLPALGMNIVNGPAWSVEDPDAALIDARAEAFKKAFTKASMMARQNGIRLGRVVTFSEYRGGGYPIYARAYEGGDMGGGPPVPIAPGSEELNVTVNVTYELE